MNIVIMQRRNVLSLYKRILKLGKTWEAVDHGATTFERDYIKNEARTFFRQNKEVKEEKEIQEHIQEGKTRLEMALHYKNPYPRPVHIPQHQLPPGMKIKMKGREKKLKQSKPVYMKSIDKES